jgi:hypothetical protein
MATGVGIIETDDVSELQQRLKALTGQAMEMAGFIVSKTLDMKAIWDQLLPVLNEVQAMLSQHCSRRQERRAIGLPTWQEWRNTFLTDSGLNVSERTAQRRLKEFRVLMNPELAKSAAHTAGQSSFERYQLLQTQLAVNQLRDAFHEGDDPSDALESVLATTISPERLREMVANSPKPREANSIGARTAGSDTLLTSSAISFRLNHPGFSSKCEIDFKPGGWALLAEYLTVDHSAQFDAVFGSLSLAEKHEVFEDFVSAIAKTVMHLDEGESHPMLPAESITPTLEA